MYLLYILALAHARAVSEEQGVRTKHKQKGPACQEMAAAPKPLRRAARTIDHWAEGADMLEGLGGVDPDYDLSDDGVPPELRAQWRPSRFGEE